MGSKTGAAGGVAAVRGERPAASERLETYCSVLSWVQRNRLPRRGASAHGVVAMRGSLFVTPDATDDPISPVLAWLDALASDAGHPTIESAPVPSPDWTELSPVDVVSRARDNDLIAVPSSAIRTWWEELVASCQAGWLLLRVDRSEASPRYLPVGVRGARLTHADELDEGLSLPLGRVRQALFAPSAASETPMWAIGTVQDGAWSVGVDEHFLAVLRHPVTHLGRVTSAIRRVRDAVSPLSS